MADVLRQATFYATTKRTELQGGVVVLAEVFSKRMGRLGEELDAWRDLMRTIPDVVECTSWKHYELRYFQPDGSPWNAARELLLAREALLERMREKVPGVLDLLDRTGAIRTVEEILKLDDVV